MKREEHEVVDISVFVPGIAINVPEAPEAVINHYLLDVLREFCKLSGYWRTPYADVFVVDGIDQYVVEGPAGTDPVAIYEVKDADDEPLSRRAEAPPGEPHYWQDQPAFMGVGNVAGGQALKVFGAVQPNGTKVSEAIYNDYRHAIERGVIAKLLKMPRKEWSSPQEAAAAEQEFRYLTEEAGRRAAEGFTSIPTKYEPRQRKFY